MRLKFIVPFYALLFPIFCLTSFLPKAAHAQCAYCLEEPIQQEEQEQEDAYDKERKKQGDLNQPTPDKPVTDLMSDLYEIDSPEVADEGGHADVRVADNGIQMPVVASSTLIDEVKPKDLTLVDASDKACAITEEKVQPTFMGAENSHAGLQSGFSIGASNLANTDTTPFGSGVARFVRLIAGTPGGPTEVDICKGVTKDKTEVCRRTHARIKAAYEKALRELREIADKRDLYKPDKFVKAPRKPNSQNKGQPPADQAPPPAPGMGKGRELFAP